MLHDVEAFASNRRDPAVTSLVHGQRRDPGLQPQAIIGLAPSASHTAQHGGGNVVRCTADVE